MKKYANLTGSKILASTVICMLVVVTCSCSKSKDKETSATSSKDGSQKTANQSATKQMRYTNLPSQIQHISDNPNFYQVSEITPADPQGKDIDSFMRPFLEKHFGAVKLVRQGDTLHKIENVPGEDDVIDSVTYVVRKLFSRDDMVALHSDLISSTGFSTSPRYGARPQGRSIIMMSIFKSSSKAKYSLTIIARTSDQTILVQSHKLGSKYDRLM